MAIYWKVRYLDRGDKQFKDRNLVLRTESLDSATKAAIELVVESKKNSPDRQVVKFRNLFREETPGRSGFLSADEFGGQMIFLPGYFEDETGRELPLNEMGSVLTGDPHCILIPGGAQKHDIDLMLGEAKPIPVSTITLAPTQLKQLGYFVRDVEEMYGTAFFSEGPGTLSAIGRAFTRVSGDPILNTSVSDEEIRSFVTIFRRLYMTREPAHFLSAVSTYSNAIGDHPIAKWVKDEAAVYESKLGSPPTVVAPFGQSYQCTFTSKRLIDVFIYTRYAHQPDDQRQRQFSECLAELQGKRHLMTWLFLKTLWECALTISNAGTQIAQWFHRYCQEKQISADVLGSLAKEIPGIGSQEKAKSRKVRLFDEKCDALAVEMWIENGRPERGPAQFLPIAKERLNAAMNVNNK